MGMLQCERARLEEWSRGMRGIWRCCVDLHKRRAWVCVECAVAVEGIVLSGGTRRSKFRRCRRGKPLRNSYKKKALACDMYGVKMKNGKRVTRRAKRGSCLWGMRL